jgi:hypothetical protein
MRTLVPIALIASALASSQAMAQKACLTGPEAEGLITFALPSAIDGIAKRCVGALPATSALGQSGSLISARYRADADQAWPVAGAAFDKLSGMKLAQTMRPDAARKLLETVVTAALEDNFKAQDCGTVDRFVDILSPLPARNLARFVVATMEMRPPKTGKSPLRLCGASGATAAAK